MGIAFSWSCFKPTLPTGGQAGPAEPPEKLSLSAFKLYSSFLNETGYRNISPSLLSAKPKCIFTVKNETVASVGIAKR